MNGTRTSLIGAGASFNLSSYNHNQYQTKYDGSFPDYVENNPPSGLWISFPLRAGIELNKKIEVNICYIPSSAILHSGIFFRQHYFLPGWLKLFFPLITILYGFFGVLVGEQAAKRLQNKQISL